MSAAAKGKLEGLLGLTQSEARLILLGVLFTDSAGKVDYEKLATNAPYKNASSASSSYRQAKKKFNDQASKILKDSATGNAEKTSLISSSTRNSSMKRKRAPAAINTDAANDYAEGEDEAYPPPPQKHLRRVSAKNGTAVKTVVESDHAITPENEDTPMNICIKTEEEEIMTELNVDAEFEAMDHKQVLAGSGAGAV
ncbi:hypothetical protein BJX76DRAFT_290670 [Aspergillus varians]